MAYNGFAIDKYLDADAVNAQLDKLIKKLRRIDSVVEVSRTAN